MTFPHHINLKKVNKWKVFKLSALTLFSLCTSYNTFVGGGCSIVIVCIKQFFYSPNINEEFFYLYIDKSFTSDWSIFSSDNKNIDSV